MYVKHLNSSVQRPIKELKGFARVALPPGETKTVSLELRGDQLAYWDASQHRFVVENDKIQIMVGSSSADAKLSKIIRVAQ